MKDSFEHILDKIVKKWNGNSDVEIEAEGTKGQMQRNPHYNSIQCTSVLATSF